MKRFVVKHLLFLLLTLLAVSFLVFILNEFSPGAVARKILGAYATQEQVGRCSCATSTIWGRSPRVISATPHASSFR
jgi:ABC-type dipeptide/oligopeptide/nickel transport system permease component